MRPLCDASRAIDAIGIDLRQTLGEPAAGAEGRVLPFPAPDVAVYDRFSPQSSSATGQQKPLWWACRRRSEFPPLV